MMSSRESYSQKKKREAVRRLSQQHSRQSQRGRAAAGSPIAGRRRRSVEKRQRGDDDDVDTRRQRGQKRDDGKRFVSPLNNPALGSLATPSASITTGGQLAISSNASGMSTSSASLFAQSSGSASEKPAASIFSQSTAFGSTSSELFKPPSVSTTSLFQSGMSTFGAYSTSGSEPKTSIFSQGLPETSSSGLKFTVRSAGTDEAGSGHAIVTQDDVGDQGSLVVSRDVSTGEAKRSTSSVFDRLSQRQDDLEPVSTGLFRKPPSFGAVSKSARTSPHKDGASRIFQDPGGTSSRSPLKREVIPEARRQLTSFDDPFDSDISDLETFGSVPAPVKSKISKPIVERESMQEIAPVKRTGLFGRALEEASSSGRDGVSKRRRDEEKPNQGPTNSARAQKGPSTFASKSDIRALKTIVCKDVPQELNNRTYLKEFFERYGRVTKVSANPRKSMATIAFEDHESAAKAKKMVKRLGADSGPVPIFWGQREKAREPAAKDENVPPVTQLKAESLVQPVKRELSPVPMFTGHSTKTYHTANERFEALEERDKQIRKGRTKQIDLASAKKMTGTCLDMCPEKERYMREVQRRLSPYEMVPGTEKGGDNPVVDHQRAVKEYSRSSADQEEPLSSELREPRVLDLTMNYLMAHIMNREPSGTSGDGRSWADWFDFLWNRTRSIRKEITQQQMGGTIAVDLMEKCARFHIYCSYRLCEEGLMTFDPKINNENLTKCLQSLKQFYHDLATEGVFCPNEAEFRAYEVLLNLTGGDILREVQQYRPEVRNSEAVVFALKVSSSFSSNNYCRFFKLIRSASFMHACILHRYFLQCRSAALDTMNKAFSAPKGFSSFPTGELVHLLAFEDEEQASYFCECHGLMSSEGAVQFSRAGFFYPEEALLPQRAPSVIEAKNNRSVGEVVNGRPLPAMHPRTPVSSFDAEGHLVDPGTTTTGVKPVERKAEPRVRVSPVTVQQQEQQPERPLQDSVRQPPERPLQDSVRQPPERPLQDSIRQPPAPGQAQEERPKISNEVVKEIARELFLEVIDGMVRQLAVSFMDLLAQIQTSPAVLEQLVKEEISSLGRRVAMETLDEERRSEAVRREEERRRRAEEAQRREQEKSALLSQVAREICESIAEEVVEGSLRVIAHHEISTQTRQEAIQRCSAMVSQEVLDDVTGSEVTCISKEVIAMAITERDRKLADIAAAMDMRQLGSCFKKWRRVHSKRMKIRRALETFPAGPPNQDQAEQLRMLWPRRQDVAGREPSLVEGDVVGRARQTLPLSLYTPYDVVSERESLARDIHHHHYLALIRQQRAWAPFDLPTIHLENAQLSQGASGPTQQADSGCRYWKVIASLPVQSGDNRTACDWLKAKLTRGKISDDVRMKRLRDDEKVETLSLFSQCSGARRVGVCTKAVRGSPGGRQAGFQLLGTGGIILTLHAPSHEDVEACYQEARRRLDATLSHLPSKPPLPLLICLVSDRDPTAASVHSVLRQRLRMDHHCERGTVASWKVITIPKDVISEKASEELQEGMVWLAAHHPRPPVTCWDPIKEYLDNGLSRFFSSNLRQLAKHKKDTHQFPLQPHIIVELYNTVISHLGSVVSSPSLADVSWPPSEFANQHHPDLPAVKWNMRETLQGLWDTIQSLQLPEVPILLADDWSSVCNNCIEYITLLPGRNSDKAPLLSRVRWLLERSRRAFEATCFVTFDTEGCEPSSQHAPWADILEECVSYKMASLSHSLDGEGVLLADLTVHYFQSELSDFELPAAWLQEMGQTLEETVSEQHSLQQSLMEAASTRRSMLTEEEELEREQRRRQKEAERRPDNRSFLLPEGGASLVGGAQRKTSHLKRMLAKEREESQRFDVLLTSLLEDPLQAMEPMSQTDQRESEFRLQLPPLAKPVHLREAEPAPVPGAPVIVLQDGAEGGHTLSDQITSLKERLAQEKRAGLLAEMRLNALLEL